MFGLREKPRFHEDKIPTALSARNSLIDLVRRRLVD